MPDSLQLGMDALDATARTPDHRALIEKLVPIAQGLSRMRPEGLIVADVRKEAARQRITLPAKPHFLGHVMRAAGLVATDEFRRSDIDESHGNAQRVWRRPS